MKKLLPILSLIFLLSTACTSIVVEEETEDANATANEAIDITNAVMIVSGKYRELQPNTLMGETVCFYVDEETSSVIPRGTSDSRIPWFCFSNQDEAKAAFGIDDEVAFSDESTECIEGEATVKISNYDVFKLEAAGADKADLLEVTSMTPYKAACDYSDY